MDTLDLYNHDYYSKYNYYNIVNKALSRETVPEVNININLEYSNNIAFT